MNPKNPKKPKKPKYPSGLDFVSIELYY